MSAQNITGTPNDPNQDLAIQTDVSCTLSNAMRAVHVTAAGVTVTFPPDPQVDQRHRILALAGDVTVAGNGHTVSMSPTVPDGVAVEYTFSVLGTWIAAIG